MVVTGKMYHENYWECSSDNSPNAGDKAEKHIFYSPTNHMFVKVKKKPTKKGCVWVILVSCTLNRMSLGVIHLCIGFVVNNIRTGYHSYQKKLSYSW